MTSDQNCVFCKIASGDIETEVVRESDRAFAFRDTNPQAPTHVLVIPRDHYPDVATLAGADPVALAELIRLAGEVATGDGVADAGYRLVFNTGAGAGQSVFHVHGHVLGGRAMSWPPG